MKILFIANQLLSSQIATGGDKVFIEIAKRWVKNGHDISIMLPEVAKKNCEKLIQPQEIHPLSSTILDNYRIYSRFVVFIGFVYLLRALKSCFKIRKLRPDIVYTTGDFFCNVIPATLAKLCNPRLKWVANIYHINEPPFKRKGNSSLLVFGSYLLQRFSFFFIKRFADKILLLNQFIKECLAKKGFIESKLHIIGAGINISEIENAEPSKKREYDACFLGRLNPSKGIFDLPKIWENVIKEKRDAKLAIIGSGTNKWINRLKNEIDEKKLSQNIFLLGFVPQEEIYKTMKSSKIFISCSYEEGWGISIGEAMICKIPVVAYDLPVYKDIFGDAIETVPIGDITEFSKTVINLLKNEKRRNKKGESGFKIALQYDWDKVAEKEMKVILGEE